VRRPTGSFIRSHLKKRILVQVRGGAELKAAGILMYFEDFKRGTNKEIGLKDFFEIASRRFFTRKGCCVVLYTGVRRWKGGVYLIAVYLPESQLYNIYRYDLFFLLLV
jgi:hypothetical protein